MVNKIRNCRLALGFKQRDIARCIGRSGPYMAALEKRDPQYITPELRSKLAHAMGLTVKELFGEDNEDTKKNSKIG